MERDSVFDTVEWVLYWSGLYTVNLLVPVMFGFLSADGSARVGMLLAILLFWVAGCVVCALPGRLRQALTRGAAVVAPSQVFPVLQIVSGCLAIDLWSELTGHRGKLGTEVAGFVVTALMAQPLIVLALTIGGVGSWWFDWRHRPSAEPEDDE